MLSMLVGVGCGDVAVLRVDFVAVAVFARRAGGFDAGFGFGGNAQVFDVAGFDRGLAFDEGIVRGHGGFVGSVFVGRARHGRQGADGVRVERELRFDVAQIAQFRQRRQFVQLFRLK
jgi:hypothetical protein